jgi:uncharacterized protein (DUF362 family)
MSEDHSLNRRNFLKTTAAIGAGAIVAAALPGEVFSQDVKTPEKPKTNLPDALKYPRTADSMPGKYPAKVVEVDHAQCITGNRPELKAATAMVSAGMLALTGAADVKKAWQTFFSPGDRIGIKVNPVAGKELSTSLEVTRAVIAQLVESGIPVKNIMIWDRREFELEETGFTPENFPGIAIKGTECKIEGSFTDAAGKLYSEQRIDKDWYYWADVEGKYDAETLPYMVNEGKFSYFTRICTQEVDKIINIPILKNAGASVTLCMKNLAYGAITNTGRLHKDLWSETTAEVCAFPPLRDKVVLNIVDGIRGCYNGGPGYNAQFLFDFKCLLFGTDPVAVDRVGYEIIQKKRKEESVQKEESPRGRQFMILSQQLGLGIQDLEKINWQKIELT